MVSVLDAAKYITEKMGEMPTMKLQKLCYYSQAWSLAWDGVPLFEQDFEAWANGPVCPELFRLHKRHFLIDSFAFPQLCGSNYLDSNEIDTIDKVLDFYGDKEAHWLSELTHRERPWREARQRANALPGDPCNEIITKESMLDYYAGLE